MFNPGIFSTHSLSPVSRLKDAWGQIHGCEPWAGMKTRTKGTTSVVHNPEKSMTFVVVDCGDEMEVTEWEGINPAHVWDQVCGRRDFESLFQEDFESWSGGPISLSPLAAARLVFAGEEPS